MANTKVKIFKDSVHGYIYVPVPYVKHIIDSNYFQRLRNIDQTGMRVLYPAAKHDRFSHSLGVFHLGQKAMDSLKTNINESDFKDFERNSKLFLTACLLHDIGHTPFSHSLEEQILENSGIKQSKKAKLQKTIAECLSECINEKEKEFGNIHNIQNREIREITAAPHEQLGSYLIFDKLEENIRRLEEELNIWENDMVFEDDKCFIVRMIMGIKYEEYANERQTRNCFIELLNGDNFDVDKLDYIVRDTQMSGISNVSVDVDRLLGSLCVVTKTKFLNKVNLSKTDIRNLTISEISNEENNSFEIDGRFKGIIKVSKGAKIEIKKDSNIAMFKGFDQELASITYGGENITDFSDASEIKQEDEWLNPLKTDSGESYKRLLGKTNNKPFNVYFKNATPINKFIIKTNCDIELHIIGKCAIKINGKFEAIGSLKIFELKKLEGAISEVEVLGDTFKEKFTNEKNSTENGYNTYSIGFKKQAINVIANVLEARNYLYLWVYAHHKVIYYANFLIPVIAKEIAQYCTSETKSFPSWELSYNNLDKLDDYYIWTVIKYIQTESKPTKFKKEYISLSEQLLSRNYYKSLYKSLAEFELVFDSFTVDKKLKALRTLQAKTDGTKPFLGSKKNKNYLSGYINNDAIEGINAYIENKELELSQVVYVVTEFKQKKLDYNKVYLDMADEILPISQIPILYSNHIEYKNKKDKYFYIYYKFKNEETETIPENTKIIKEAIRTYFNSMI